MNRIPGRAFSPPVRSFLINLQLTYRAGIDLKYVVFHHDQIQSLGSIVLKLELLCHNAIVDSF